MPPDERTCIRFPDYIDKLSCKLTRLFWAVENGNVLVCRQLLADISPGSISYNVIMNHRDHLGLTLFLRAIVKGHLNIVRLFVEELSADLYMEHTDLYSSLPIHLAVANGHEGIVTYLVDLYPEMLTVEDGLGATLLHRAAMSGQLKILQYCIIEKGLVPHFPTRDGHTPLHFAAKCGQMLVVQYLAESWSYLLLLKTQDDNLPLHLAAFEGKLDVLKYFLEQKMCKLDSLGGDGQTVLHMACDRGHAETVRYVIDVQPALLAIKDGDGNLPIHRAAYSGKLDIIRYFIEEDKYPVDVTGEDSRTPIHFAAMGGSLDVVKYLTEHGADMYVEDSNWNRTPYHWATQCGFVEIVQYLHRIDPNQINHEDANCSKPIHAAADGNHVSLLMFFVEECGQNVDVMGASQWTPLAAAVGSKCHSKAAIRYLIAKGASLDIQVSLYLHTLLHLAVDRDHLDVVEELLAIKPDLMNVPNDDGKTALEYAKSENKQAAALLIEERLAAIPSNPKTNK